MSGSDIHLFLLVPNDSGGTWLQNSISLCENCVSFPPGLDGHGAAIGPYPRIKINKLFSENLELWCLPENFNWSEIKQRWLEKWASSPNYQKTPRVYLEKTPMSVFMAHQLAEQFDNVRFIVMNRNPYAVAEGMRRTITEKVSIGRCTQHWIMCARQQLHNLSVYDDISLELTYEELVGDSEETERKIREFIPELHDIDFRKEVPAHTLDGQFSLPVTDFNQRHIDNLTATDLRAINKELDQVPEVLESFGYETIHVEETEMISDRVTIISTCERRTREQDVSSKNYEPMSKRLVHSIRTNGGKYKDVPIVMWHASDAAPSQETQDWLRDNGCTLVEGEILVPQALVGNKINACCVPVSTEYSLWMDSDMYVLDTELFEELIDLDVDVAASGSEYGHHRWGTLDHASRWSQFYELVGVDAPLERFKGGLDGEPVHFYFNSAIVLFRNGRNFPQVWRELAPVVRASGVEEATENFTQTSLTLAALKTDSVCKQLPQTYNAYFALEKEASLDRAVLHYQDSVIDFDPRVKWDV